MKKNATKYFSVLAIIVVAFFIFGLIGNIIDTITNYIHQYPIIFSLIVISSIIIYLKYNSFLPLNHLDNSNLSELLKFTIGEQYENYEFVLKSKGEKTVNEICYEIYLYEKDDFKTLFDLPISRGILLLFNADILSAVYYRFQGNHFEYLLSQINSYLPKNKRMVIDPFVAYRATCNLDSNTVLELLVKKDGNTGIGLKNKSVG